jgi:hypothetical protein
MNIVQGTILKIDEPMFDGGSFSKFGKRGGSFVGNRKWQGVIVNDSYSESDNCKHWFTIECTESEHASIIVGKKYRRQGKNLYGNSVIIAQPADESIKTELKNKRKQYASQISY